MVLDHLQPQSVMSFFEQLSAIPHGSGNTDAIAAYCAAFAASRGLEWHQDEHNNVIIIKPATFGCEGAEPIILQGHLDMVCEKDVGSDFDFMNDPLQLETDGDYVWAKGTTLGGDDGIAIAMALAILDSYDLQHPRIEALFTTDEETGMFGAAGLDPEPLTARRMINLDSEDEGIFTVSCAGGVRANCLLDVSRAPLSATAVTLTLGGLKGGHSGGEIDKGRGNANILMGRALRHVADALPLQVVELAGGAMDNAIPVECRATLAVAPEHTDALLRACAEMDAVLKAEYAASDAGVFLRADCGGSAELSALDEDSSSRVMDALLLLPNGIQEMSMDMPGLVETSLNLGILKLESDHLRASFSVRSSVGSRKAMLKARLSRLCARLGGRVEFSGEYPAWEYKKDSPLRDLAAQVYRDQYGSEPTIIAIHAGLECGLLSEKLPGLDCVSFGPNMQDIHTPRERMDVKSVQRVWDYTVELLRRLAEEDSGDEI